MGATTKLGLPWPAGTARLKDGYAAIRSLAEAVEAQLLPPLIACNSSDEPDWDGTDKSGRVAWDVSSPTRRRGAWGTGGSSERLVLPPGSGWFIVSTSFKYGGKAASDTYELKIQTKTPAQTQGQAFTWITDRTEVPAADPSTSTIKTVCTLVRCEDAEGIQVLVTYDGSSSAPATTLGANKLRILKVSAL